MSYFSKDECYKTANTYAACIAFHLDEHRRRAARPVASSRPMMLYASRLTFQNITKPFNIPLMSSRNDVGAKL